MRDELKKAIIAYIFENKQYMQLTNNTVDSFRAYIYDSTGEYLIGGKEVSDWIDKAIDLITEKQ